MAESLDPESFKRQLTKQILDDMRIFRVLGNKYGNAGQFNQFIDEYGKCYRQLYKYIDSPLKESEEPET